MTLSQAECPSECPCEVENRLLESDKRKLLYLYERVVPDLRQVAKDLLPHSLADEHEDVMQDVFMLYARQATTGECGFLNGRRIRDVEDSDLVRHVSACYSYLTGLITNKCRQVCRRAKKSAVCDMDVIHSTLCQHLEPRENMENDEESQLVQEAASNLPEPFREVIMMHYYEHLSTPEIAAALDISEGTVRSRLHRGREQLKKPLKTLAAEYA
jgi:RNA polymerase sigma-70 factor (ECF subfamily)